MYKYRIEEEVGNNGIIYLYDVNPYIKPSGKKERKARFKCTCGKEFEAIISSVKSGNTKSCGCYMINKIKESNTIHGLRSHPLYIKWASIVSRCNNKNVNNYERYGGRNIKICKEWRKNFKSFYDYVTKLPNYRKKGVTLDRIDNDGNYEPGNLRWITIRQQNINRRTQKNNTSGYIGIGYNKYHKKWSSIININKKQIHIGYFLNKEDAIKSRNAYIVTNNLKEYSIQKI